MGNWAISADRLGKRYLLSEGPRSDTLAEAVVSAVRRWKKGQTTRAKPKEFWALRDATFEISIGERVGIIGANGAGKSTLLKILSRVTQPTEGEARVRGRVASLLEVGTGFHPELTGRENVYLNGAVNGLSSADIDRVFDSIVDFAGVEQFIDTPIKHYSSGMYVRLAFSVAAQLDPEILIMDEVLAVGDAAFQKKSARKIDAAAREGRTILLVSHSMAAIRSLCDQTILLEHGTLKAFGKTADVVDAYIADTDEEQARTAVAEFSDDPNKPLRVRRVAVVDSTRMPTRNFDIDATVSLEVEYHLKQQFSRIMVIFAVSRDGTYIFQTHDTDLDDSLLRERRAGYYRSTIQIPRRLLTSGTYHVSAKVARGAHGEDGDDYAPDAVSFVLHETTMNGANNTKGWAQSRANLIIVEPKWKTELLGNP